MDTLQQPLVGAPDAKGFRAFSLFLPPIYLAGKEIREEIVRVSFNLDAQRRYLDRPVGPDVYSDSEREQLNRAAEILYARSGFPEDFDPSLALHERVNIAAIETTEQWFPILAVEALRVASDISIKRAVNDVVMEYGVARVYDDDALDALLKNFRGAIKQLLAIRQGRTLANSDHWRQILEKGEAFVSENGRVPTQEKLAERLRILPRRLQQWITDIGASWGSISAFLWRRRKDNT